MIAIVLGMVLAWAEPQQRRRRRPDGHGGRLPHRRPGLRALPRHRPRSSTRPSDRDVSAVSAGAARAVGGFVLGALMVVFLPPLAFAMALVLGGVVLWARLRQRGRAAAHGARRRLPRRRGGLRRCSPWSPSARPGATPGSRLCTAPSDASASSSRGPGRRRVSASTKSLPDPGEQRPRAARPPAWPPRTAVPSSASRRSAEPRPSRETGDQATSGTARSESPSARTRRAHGTSQSPASPDTRHQPGADPAQLAADAADAVDLERDVAAHRRHQPARPA